MTMLATGTCLGELELVDVYFTYDFPRIFSCKTRNSGGERTYLVSFLEDVDGGERWLYLDVSPERFDAILSGAIDLHDAYSQAESGTLFEVETRFALGNGTARRREDRATAINAESLTEEMLPAPGALLVNSPSRRDVAELRVPA